MRAFHIKDLMRYFIVNPNHAANLDLGNSIGLQQKSTSLCFKDFYWSVGYLGSVSEKGDLLDKLTKIILCQWQIIFCFILTFIFVHWKDFLVSQLTVNTLEIKPSCFHGGPGLTWETYDQRALKAFAFVIRILLQRSLNPQCI